MVSPTDFDRNLYILRSYWQSETAAEVSLMPQSGVCVTELEPDKPRKHHIWPHNKHVPLSTVFVLRQKQTNNRLIIGITCNNRVQDTHTSFTSHSSGTSSEAEQMFCPTEIWASSFPRLRGKKRVERIVGIKHRIPIRPCVSCSKPPHTGARLKQCDAVCLHTATRHVSESPLLQSASTGSALWCASCHQLLINGYSLEQLMQLSRSTRAIQPTYCTAGLWKQSGCCSHFWGRITCKGNYVCH